MGRRSSTFFATIALAVVLVCTVGVVFTADRSPGSPGHPGRLIDDKDDDSGDIAQDQAARCLFGAEPRFCPTGGHAASAMAGTPSIP